MMDEQHDDGTGVAAPEEERHDLLERVRARRRTLGDQREPEVWDVPGYEGELCVRYRYVPLEDLGKGSRELVKVKDVSRRNLLAACDTLIACCDEVLIRVDGEERPLSTDGIPIRFDSRCAEELGFEVPESRGARGVVQGVFNNDYALIRQAMEVGRWLETGSREIDEALLGE